MIRSAAPARAGEGSPAGSSASATIVNSAVAGGVGLGRASAVHDLGGEWGGRPGPCPAGPSAGDPCSVTKKM